MYTWITFPTFHMFDKSFFFIPVDNRGSLGDKRSHQQPQILLL